jgi:hypothetical protein
LIIRELQPKKRSQQDEHETAGPVNKQRLLANFIDFNKILWLISPEIVELINHASRLQTLGFRGLSET